MKKYSIRFYILLFFIPFIPVFSFAGASVIDSLKNVLSKANEDTAKVSVLSNLAGELNKIRKFDEAREYISEGIVLAKKLSYIKALAALYIRSGDNYNYQNNYDKSIEQYQKSQELEKKEDRKNKVALCYDKIAKVYVKTGQHSKAVTHFEEAWKRYEQSTDTIESINVLISIWEVYNFKISDKTKAEKYYSEAFQLANNSKDSVMALLYNRLGDIYSKEEDYEKASEYLNKSQYLYEKIGDKKGLADVYFNIGVLYENTGNYQKTLEYFLKILMIRIELTDKFDKATAYNNVGWGYQLTGNYTSALGYQLKALKLYEAIGDDFGAAWPLGNLGIIYNKLGDYDKAIEYSTKARILFEKAKDDIGVAEAYNNMGNAYRSMKKYAQALRYLHKGLKISSTAEDNKYEVKNSYEGLSATYQAIGDYKNAYRYHQLFFQLKDSIVNQENSERVNKIQSRIENEKKQKEIELLNKDVLLNAAELKRQRMVTYSVVSGIALLLLLTFFVFRYRHKQKAHKQLEKYNTEILSQKEEIEKSYRNTKLLSDIGRDITSSLSVEEITGKVYENVNALMDASVLAIGIYDADKNVLNFPGDIEKGEKLPFAYEELTDENRTSVWCFKNQKEIFIRDVKNDYAKYFPGREIPAPTTGEQTESIIYFPLSTPHKKIGVITIQSFKRNAYTEYHLDIIRNLAIYVTTALENARLYGNMEAEVKERTAEIEKQRDKLANQNSIISEKNKHITDSINYAKLIQDAILPSDGLIKSFLPKSLVLFKPKDIVSGDFYWVTKKHDKIFFAVVDCTGHGVPGAFVSIIGHSSLYRAVNEFAMTKPSKILDKLNELVEEMFGQNGTARIKDGMDIALCSYDRSTKTLEFAGANNPIYIVSDAAHKFSDNNKSVVLGKWTLSEVKGDKQPIGAFDNRKKFTNHSFKLKEGDTVYIFSDGYADQFGGVSNKKFMYSQFKNTILSMQEKPVSEHRDILNNQIEKWKSNFEQVDDICVMGVRV